MNIIFGMESVKSVEQRYTVLELDTFVLQPTNEIVTAYCLVETIPIPEMPAVENLKKQHADLMAEYQKQNWQFCETAIAYLTGKWGGEVDSFYTELYHRIQNLKHQDLPTDWSGTLTKTIPPV